MSERCDEARLYYAAGRTALDRNLAVTAECRDNCPLNGLSVVRQGEAPSEVKEAAYEALFQKMESFCPVLQAQRLESRRLKAAVNVVNMFDQVNRGRSVENMGDRGILLKQAIEDLRIQVNSDQQRTILTSEQANS
jgi:hypothetical protein